MIRASLHLVRCERTNQSVITSGNRHVLCTCITRIPRIQRMLQLKHVAAILPFNPSMRRVTARVYTRGTAPRT